MIATYNIGSNLDLYKFFKNKQVHKCLVFISAETNMKFSIRIVWVEYPNSLNKPIYHKNAWFMLKYIMEIP